MKLGIEKIWNYLKTIHNMFLFKPKSRPDYIYDIESLNYYLIGFNSIEEVDYIKTEKLIKIVNNMLSMYDFSLVHNKKDFEKIKAYMIKDLIKNDNILTKDFIKKEVENKLSGIKAYDLKLKYIDVV